MALKDEQSRLATGGKFYLTFMATHPIDGSLTFYLGDQHFPSNNQATGGFQVYPVVTSWGALRQFMTQDGSDRSSEFSVQFAGLPYVVASAGTKRYQVFDLFRSLYGLFDTAVSIYQWNSASTTQQLVLTAYWRGVDSVTWNDGVMLISVRVSMRPSTMDRPIGKMIDTTSYPPANPDSVGKMIARAYGDFTVTPLASLGTQMAPVVFGYGGRYVPGIVVREDLG